MKIVIKNIAGHRAYFFRYSAGGMKFEFSLLSEVGQPFIPSFERMISERGLDLRVIEINERPWLITVLNK